MRKLIFITLMSGICFANSPSALGSLTKEHTEVYPTHEKQYITIINKKEIMKDILISKANFIFELNKFKHLLFNNFIIDAEKKYYKE
ncbi:TPA: hypothetical protein RPV63_001536 [Campylobacter fetus subsp. venerealis]|nr:hypothetical protein [Campylobacter fetus subsp. venerealis]HDX6253975.1 hypothetical protein [Campylobacter fetus subsp. venerealis]HDX6261822.1 hypothetical protein [Campylobacter fetus subsp. venerealis]HDX6263952.1 hypothetical protein [Campylobacter fetus subsp. venerealis]HDX6265301.1 hypothetical protein [Campylobacter fetus subsp. venerealis]